MRTYPHEVTGPLEITMGRYKTYTRYLLRCACGYAMNFRTDSPTFLGLGTEIAMHWGACTSRAKAL